MKKSALLILSLGFVLVSHNAFCADEKAAPAAELTPVTPVTAEAVEPATAAVAEGVAPAAEPTPVATEVAEPAPLTAEVAPAVPADNLEFISGEISAIDPAAKTVTVKLYGETENAAADKFLVISLDDTTDITDGEKDRDLKSLASGTEVDVEYDPATKKATYIFVY
jgi:hypothetical protein